jgi:hypothetical protein
MSNFPLLKKYNKEDNKKAYSVTLNLLRAFVNSECEYLHVTVYNGMFEIVYQLLLTYSFVNNIYPEKEFLQFFLKKFFKTSILLGNIKIVKTQRSDPIIEMEFKNGSKLKVEYPLEDSLNPCGLDGNRVFRIVRTQFIDRYNISLNIDIILFDFSSDEEFQKFLYYIYCLRFSS